MRSKLCNIALLAATTAALALASAAPAATTVFEDISGKWCGATSSYTFTPSRLIVMFYADNSRREYNVDDYRYEEGAITVSWERDGDKLATTFGEFTADNKFMAQQLNDAGPRREFRRCS